MGTKGLFGFRYNSRYYMVYNHFDSYFSGIGMNLLNEIRKLKNEDKFDERLEMFKKLRIVTENDKPTKADIVKCQPYLNKMVFDGYDYDYYSLLRNCQGSFERVLHSGYLCRYDIDDIKDKHNSLEYGYVLDFDAKSFIIHYERDEGTKVEEFDLNHLPRSLDDNGEHIYDEETPALK